MALERPVNQRISVVVNTYNAEKYLDKVLTAVSDFDEIVVCDMESTDSTLDIARAHGCKVVTFPKGDHKSAEPARTFAIQSASSPWVLVVDADEIVTEELKEYLYATVAHEDHPAGLWIPRRGYFFHTFMPNSYPDYQLRFFQREGTTWPPYVHTFPEVKGRLEYIPRRRRDTAFIHLADDTIRVTLHKMNEYTDNEVVKKADKHYGLGALLWRPCWRFFRSYVIRGNWRAGTPGFISAVMDGYYQFIMVSKMIELRYQGRHIMP